MIKDTQDQINYYIDEINEELEYHNVARLEFFGVSDPIIDIEGRLIVESISRAYDSDPRYTSAVGYGADGDYFILVCKKLDYVFNLTS